MVISCVAYGCTNRQKSADSGQEKLQFHRFPLKNPELSKKWIMAVRRKDWKPTKYSFICSSHFTEDSYKSAARHYLKDEAVPSLFNFPAHLQKTVRRRIIEKHLDDMEQSKSIGTGYWCLVPNCYNKRQITKTVFFSFPKEKSRSDSWLISCGREDLLNKKLGHGYVICSHHFDKNSFMDPYHKKLKPNAVPTIIPTSPKGSYAIPGLPSAKRKGLANDASYEIENDGRSTNISFLSENIYVDADTGSKGVYIDASGKRSNVPIVRLEVCEEPSSNQGKTSLPVIILVESCTHYNGQWSDVSLPVILSIESYAHHCDQRSDDDDDNKCTG